MKDVLKIAAFIGVLLLADMAYQWMRPIYAITGGALVLAISIVFAAVLSKAYRNWPT